MIYNVSFAGATAIATPKQTVFGINKITLKNGSHYFHKVVILDISQTDAEMEAILLTDVPEWTANTVLRVEFNNNLFGGNIGIDLDDVVRIGVSRAIIDSTGATGDIETINDNIDPDALYYIDWIASTSTDYYYYVYFVDSNGNTSALVRTDQITSMYDSCYLIDPVQEISYRFNYDSSQATIAVTDGDSAVSSPYSQYPLFNKTETQFEVSTVNCLLGYADTNNPYEYVDSLEYLDSLKSTIKNSNPKYWKDRSGRIKKVQTNNFRYLPDEKISTHPITISFDYTEIDSIGGDS